MPSRARSQVLDVVLADVDQLIDVHEDQTGTERGRRWNVDAINRSGIVLTIAGWESFIEALAKEAAELHRPSPPATPTYWTSLQALTDAHAGKLNTPNAQNTCRLFADTVGPADVSLSWTWKGMSRQQARDNLDEWLRLRHQVAHGAVVTPAGGTPGRPKVSKADVQACRDFVRTLAERTEVAVGTHLSSHFGITTGW